MENNWFDIYDLLLFPIYFAVILFHAFYVKNKNILKNPNYRFYIPGVLCKLLGGTAICLVYTYYYTYGGDTTNYFLTAKSFTIVLENLDFSLFWDMINYKTNSLYETGFLQYEGTSYAFQANDYYALFNSVLLIPFCFFGANSFIPTTLLLAYFSFKGIWRLYLVFTSLFSNLASQFAIALFFVPSVFFWGSGMLKDTVTLCALGYCIYGIYSYFILKKRKFKYLILMFVAIYIMLFVKPYVFFALLPGSFIWIFFDRIKKLKNPILRATAIPLIMGLSTALIIFSMQLLAEYLGEYSLNNVLDKAVKTQQDLIRSEAYGNNNFDIGKFDPTIAGITSKMPVAINLALFRPYIWDSRNVVMAISGIENLFMLGFSIYILLRVKTIVLIKSLFSNPFLMFCFFYALFFAFAVGLTTANYGALVRLKIPCIPFYICSLFILYSLNQQSFKRR